MKRLLKDRALNQSYPTAGIHSNHRPTRTGNGSRRHGVRVKLTEKAGAVKNAGRYYSIYGQGYKRIYYGIV